MKRCQMPKKYKRGETVACDEQADVLLSHPFLKRKYYSCRECANKYVSQNASWKIEKLPENV